MADSYTLAEGARAEKLGMLDRALETYEAAAASSNPVVVSEALRRQADIHRLQCDWDRAVRAARHAQRVADDARLPQQFAEALNCEASVLLARGELKGARRLFEQLVDVATDARLRGIGLQNLGSVYAQQHDLDAAERAFAESHECFAACGYARGKAITLNNQGRAALDRGDVARASRLLAAAVDAARDVEDEELIALTITNLGEAILATEDYARASDLVCTALGHFRTSGNRWREVECLRLLGAINARRGHHQEARRCYAGALTLARRIDARLEITAIEQAMAQLAPAVGPFAAE